MTLSNLGVGSAGWVSDMCSSSGMIFPLKLGFLEAARYIIAVLPVVVVGERAGMTPVLSGACSFVSSLGGLASE